ncbi:MAG TPA: DMT family transporter [Solirubrobacteraceae bacterium]|nr:DMT family transporter [Solirubrobacteraceae bacterium]
MLAVLLALVASSCWGVADFIGGLRSRRVALPVVLAFVEGTGFVLVLALIALESEPLPSTRALLLSLAAGLAGVLGLGAFYRALAIGTMSIVAPISATAVALPVVLGVATGDRLSAVTSAGLACAVVGVVLASREADAGTGRAAAGRASIALALAAAVGFGSYFALSDAAADESVLWLLVVARVVVLPVLAAIVLVRRPPRPTRPDALALVAAGTLDVSATGLYGLANTKGALSIVSVVGSLYPVTTVLLARAVLGERIRAVQTAGILAALAGVALIAAG